MTLKNSLIDKRMVSEKFKRTSWVTAIFGVMMFFALPVATLFTVQNATEVTNEYSLEHIIDTAQNIIGRGNIFVALIVTAMAIFIAAAVFSYQHNKKQVDFYNSLPVKRGAMFASGVLSGFLSFLFVYLASVAVSLLILAFSPIPGAITLSVVFGGIITNIIGFCATYALAILAQMFGGTALTSIFATGVLIIAPIALYGCHYQYMSYSFQTYFVPSSESVKILQHISPVVAHFSNTAPNNGAGWAQAIYWIAITAVIIAASAYLSTKRPSEAAGRAAAFGLPAAVLKYATVIVCALGMGIIFRSIGGGMMWQMFGIVCGAVISHCVIEAILHFEFKSLFCHWKAMVVVVAAICGVVTLQHYDVLGYDEFVPKAQKVKSISIELESWYDRSKEDFDQSKARPITDREVIDAAIRLAQNAVDAEREEGPSSYRTIAYKTNLGRKIYRQYLVNDTNAATLADEIKVFNSEEYKKSTYGIFAVDAQSLHGVTAQFGEPGLDIKMKYGDFAAQLAKTVQEEMLALDGAELSNVMPFAILEFTENTSAEDIYSRGTVKVYVYPQFTKTIELMKQEGLWHPVEFDADKIREIVIVRCESDVYYATETKEDIEYKEIRITDKAQIEQLIAFSITPAEQARNMFFESDEYEARVIFNDANQYEQRIVFAKGAFPMEVLG